MPRYLLYVDDSGTREYDDHQNYETSGKSLYFVYGAILIEQDTAAQLVPRFQELKRTTFGTSNVEIKSNWLRIPKERRSRYLHPFNKTEKELTAFVDNYYQLLVHAKLELLGSVVNKQHMQEDYKPPREPWYAPTAAYEFLMQRVAQAIPNGSTVLVTVDDISGKTPGKKNLYKELLAKHHAKLRAYGTKWVPKISFQCVEPKIRFVSSQHFDLIQAADLVSYDIQRQFKDFGEEWEKPKADGSPLTLYPHFGRIVSKFRHDGSGRIQGYGIAKCPLRTRVRWSVKKKR